MLWIPLVIFVAVVASLCVFIDNYVSDVFFKGQKPYAQKIIGIFSYFIIAIVLAIIFPPFATPIHLVLIFIFTGLISSVGSIPYYSALSSENTTAATIFVQLSPLIYLIVGWTLLGDVISPIQILAFLLVLSAPLFVIFSSRKKHQKLKLKTALFLLIYVIFAVSANLIFVNFSKESVFIAAFFWYIVGKFFADLILSLIFKSWRIRFKNIFKKHKIKFTLSVITSQTLGAITELAYRLALTLAPVAIVSVAANTLQLIATFIMGIVLTLLWPIFGREKLTARNIRIHLVATILATIGIILMQ